MNKAVLFISLRYFLTRNRESFISVINAFSMTGIAIGVATLIIVMSVMKGYEIHLMEKILGLNGHLNIRSADDELSDYQSLIENLSQKYQEILFIAPVINKQSVVLFRGGTAGISIYAMNSEDMQRKPVLSNSLIAGDWPKDGEILIGKVLSKHMSLQIGDKIRVLSPSFDNTIVGPIPRFKSFIVSGIFDFGMYDYNASVTFINLHDAQIFFEYKNSVEFIDIMIKDFHNTESFKQKLLNTLGQEYIIDDWTAYNKTLVNALRVERNVMFLILTLMIIIAAFNTISGLVMLVKDKTSHIAILMTFGMSQKQIMAIFMICGSLIGICGTLVGLILGVIISYNIKTIQLALEILIGKTIFDPMIYFLTNVPSHLEWHDVITITLMSIILSIIATLYPAYRASKLLPSEALRYG